MDVLFVAALHAETVSLLNEVNFADQLGVGRVLFETDCLVLQQAMPSDAYDLAPLGQMFKELKLNLVKEFSQASVVHTTHECYKPAHVLAEQG